MPSPMLTEDLSRITLVGFSHTVTLTRADRPFFVCTVIVADPARMPLICVPFTATYFLLLVERLYSTSHA